MKSILFAVAIVFQVSIGVATAQKYVIVVHGGAGDGITPENINADKKVRYDLALSEALMAGEARLKDGGTAVDAVETVLRVMEDSPLFNAGKGSVLNWEGIPELDASIMNGQTLEAGSVAGVSRVKNPISLARRVMDSSMHVMLSSRGAEEYARTQNLESVPPEYFITDDRKKSLERYKVKYGFLPSEQYDFSKYGTVGCVVLDNNGHIAAGTSTGGMTGKRYGRIGDSPIIGAGTYASDQTCGISCTGHGEFFIRYGVAHDLHARIKYSGTSLEEASEELIMKELLSAGGKGGIIGIDKDGQVVMKFNTKGMFRGYVVEGDRPITLMFD